MLEKIGIGIDIVNINRFKKKPFEKNKNFYKKIFHDAEIQYCLNKKNSTESFATKFAIKESVIKSIGKEINLLDIMTEHENLKPIAYLLNDLTYKFLVSVSHESSYAIAVVISEET